MSTDDTEVTEVPSAHRSVEVNRSSLGRYVARNARGGTLALGTGEDDDFTPVELLLAAIGGCSLVDVDFITSRRVEPERLDVRVGADKLDDEQGHHLGAVTVTFSLELPEDADRQAVLDATVRAARASHERLCTVSRTVMLPTPVRTLVEGVGEVAAS